MDEMISQAIGAAVSEVVGEAVAEAANLPGPPLSAVVVDAETLAYEGGEEAGFGSVRWKTLFCGDRTATTDMVVGIAEFGPFATLESHRHGPSEVYVCTAGSGTVTVDGVAHAVRPGIAVFIPAEAEHGTVAGPEGLTFTYCFPRARFSEVDYRFSAAAAVPGTASADLVAEAVA